MSTPHNQPPHAAQTGATPAKAGAANDYPKTMYEHTDSPPFYKPVVVKSADDAKPQKGKPPLFATVQEAEAYPAPEPQPIDHMQRTGNPEQFDERKSQAGRTIPAGVIQTQPPVSNVYVQTGVDTTTGHMTVVLPEGIDSSTLTTVSMPGAQITPVVPPDDSGANPPAAAKTGAQQHHT